MQVACENATLAIVNTTINHCAAAVSAIHKLIARHEFDVIATHRRPEKRAARTLSRDFWQ
jgi:hypothetical protein